MTERHSIHINGVDQHVNSPPERPLLDVLREDLGLTGAKYGCGEGECGACTVLLDGVATRSCITSIEEAAGAKIETIEGLPGETLHPVQQAFIDQQAMQCGYCVPGQIMNAVGLLRENPHPSEQLIVKAMSGNLCRCCNYRNLRAAVQQAAE